MRHPPVIPVAIPLRQQKGEFLGHVNTHEEFLGHIGIAVSIRKEDVDDRRWFRTGYRRPRTGKGAALRILERLGNFRDVVVGVLSRPHETSEESPARSRRPGRLRHSESSNRGGPRKMVPAPTIQAATPPSEKSRLHGSPGANPAPVSSPIPLRLSSARPNRLPIQRYSHPV
jgi:hypothetical protein